MICIAGPVKSEKNNTTGKLEKFYSQNWWGNYWQQSGFNYSQESSRYRVDDEDIEVNSIIVKKVAEKN